MFDTNEELAAHIRLGEDSQLELKQVRATRKGIIEPHSNSIAQEIAAFANSARGGVMVFGVDDSSREIIGLSHDESDGVELSLRNILNDALDPPLSANIGRIELPDSLGISRTLLRIDIPRSLYVHKAPGGYFERIGSSKREIAAPRLARLIQQRDQSRLVLFDESPVPGTSIETLDAEFFSNLIGDTELTEHEILEKMGVLCPDSEGRTVCSVAGVLMATHRPDQVLHGGAYIEAVHYAGTERDSDMQVTARRITGPVDRQILDAFDFVRGAMLRPATKQPARIERPAFSEKAVFEGIVNAVVHRDYSVSGSKIRLFVFSDRLEIYSPGALPNTLTVDTLRYRQFTRNETLISLLGRLRFEIDLPDAPIRRGRFMESRGEGVPIIFQESKNLGAPPPVFEMFDDSELRLTIFAQP